MNVSLDLEQLPKHFVVLVNTDMSKKVYAYDVLDNLHRDTIYVALTHPAHNVYKTLDRLGIDHSRIHFIDAVSKKIDAGLFLDGCEYLHNRDFNTVLTAIENTTIKKPIRDNVLVIDTLHHWLMQEDKNTAVRFIDFLNKRLKVLRLSSILFVDLERLHPKVREKLETISDKTIHL